MKNILFLGSSSSSRSMLLQQAGIPFKKVAQTADESKCDWGLPLKQVVSSISAYKMQHVILPDGKAEGEYCFVLTADTLSQSKDGTIEGKPIDHEDATRKIKRAREGTTLATAFCLDKKVWRDGIWELEERIADCVTAEYLFYVPDNSIDHYFEHSMGLSASNAIAVEGYGDQFLKEVRGSYSTIVGLPMFEVRQALNKLGFFS